MIREYAKLPELSSEYQITHKFKVGDKMKEIEDLGSYGGFILLKNKNFDDLKKDY